MKHKIVKQKVLAFCFIWRTQLVYFFTILGIFVTISLTQQWIDNAKLRSLANIQKDKVLQYKIREIEKLFEFTDRQTKRIEFCNLVEPPQEIHPIKKYILADLSSKISNTDFPSSSLTLQTVANILKQVEIFNKVILAITSTSQEFDTGSFSQLTNGSAKILAFEDVEGNIL